MAAAGSMPSPQLLEEYSQFFRLLSEPARLQLLCLLAQEPLDGASLIEATGFSQSHVSRQLGQLQRAGLVTSAPWCRTGSGSAWKPSSSSLSRPKSAPWLWFWASRFRP
ncbi:MAG: hypothetical protein RLZZ374_1893 [Cyanobacteriota bacterium]